MKIFYLLIIIAVVSSCAEDNLNNSSNNTENSESGVECSVTPLVLDGDEEDFEPTTRTSLSFNNTTHGMDFSWDDTEWITVFPNITDQTSGSATGKFQLISQNGLNAKFNGNGFNLSKNLQYYTISKAKWGTGDSETNAPSAFNADNSTNIKLTYEGQRQLVNGVLNGDNTDANATAHLGKYDYMTATAIATDENVAHFTFKHLGLTLRCKIKGLPKNIAFTEFRMYDASDDSYRELARTTNITNGYSENTATYNPYLNEPEITSTSQRFNLMLGQKENNVEQGITPTDGVIVTYIEIPPVDFTGKTIAFRLIPKDGQTYQEATATSKIGDEVKPWYCLRNGQQLQAGTCMNFSMTASECTKYNINVKVVKDWNKGNVTSQTRSTGDPGNAVTLDKPKYLYAFFVNDKKLVSFAKAEGTVTDNIGSGIDASDWADADGIYSYSGKWINTSDGSSTSESTSLTLDASNSTNPRVYMIASSKQISSWKDKDGNSVTFKYGTLSGTAESVIQGLSYNYTNQEDLVNLYSTAYVDGSSFAGTLGDDVKDVRLYHVASKVDINWENEKTQTVGEIKVPVPLSGSVSLNNIPTTNLSFFNPTTNAEGTEVISGAAITTGTAYNGRQVWYVPQISGGTYNVTIGSTTQDITFTPDDTYTSWFRGLVTIK